MRNDYDYTQFGDKCIAELNTTKEIPYSLTVWVVLAKAGIYALLQIADAIFSLKT